MRPLLLAGALVLGSTFPTSAAIAAELPRFDAHIHYSHDAWEATPPAEAIAILRKAGLRRALVSSSGDEGTQQVLDAAEVQARREDSQEPPGRACQYDQ